MKASGSRFGWKLMRKKDHQPPAWRKQVYPSGKMNDDKVFAYILLNQVGKRYSH
jgi:hypothetical protein